jgi:hypothetical protein
LRLHFGLGADETIQSVNVRWSNGETESVSGVTTNRIITITQGKGVTASVAYRTLRKG